MKHTHSAGGVVLNKKGLVLVVNQHHDSWSLPKGHIDEGEDALAAAKREIAEESGITDLQLVKSLGNYERYRIPHTKTSHFTCGRLRNVMSSNRLASMSLSDFTDDLYLLLTS